jgi:hypothetical protein
LESKAEDKVMAILRGVSSRQLACGCLIGVYETYDGEIVSILDARRESCVDPAHVEGQTVPNQPESRSQSRPTSSRD